MRSKKIFNSTLWAVLTIVVAFLTLLYPIVNEEINIENFHFYPKDFENSYELQKRDINESIIRAKRALEDNTYCVSDPVFDAISFKDAWISSSPNLIEYVQKKNNVYKNTTHEYLAQSLGILYDLIITHQKSKDIRFLKKGYEIIGNWAENNTRFDIFQSPLMWNDHVASNRIIAILLFNDYSTQYIKPKDTQQKIINKILKDSILYLASPYNYKQKHNHGIFQDFALLISSEYLLDKEKQKVYSTIALDRFAQQVRDTYDDKGVHLENSPGYHLAITDLLNNFVLYAKKLNLTIDSKTLNKVKLANENKYFFVLNNGNVPPVGDSTYGSYDDFNQQDDQVMISQDAGYVIFKDKTYYLLMRTQSISNVHAHQDQLSFIYEVQKDLIISEPGFLDYSSSMENIFVHSPKAHNTVYFEDPKKTNYYFNKVLNNEQFFYCQIFSVDKSISRDFLLDKKLKILMIQDIINNDNEKKLFEILNLSSEVVQVKNEKNWQEIEMINKHKYYIGSFQDEDYIGANILYGSKKPYFGGWRTVPYNNLIPSYALLIPLEKKKNIKFTRIISRNPIESFSHKNNSVAMTIGKDNIAYDLNSINQQSNTNSTINAYGIEYKSYIFIDKVKKKISPYFYKRIKIFIYESLIMIFMFLLYIIFRKAYTRWFAWSIFAVINLFNILVFIVA